MNKLLIIMVCFGVCSCGPQMITQPTGPYKEYNYMWTQEQMDSSISQDKGLKQGVKQYEPSKRRKEIK